jgi:hypothetical protein
MVPVNSSDWTWRHIGEGGVAAHRGYLSGASASDAHALGTANVALAESTSGVQARGDQSRSTADAAPEIGDMRERGAPVTPSP